MRELTQVEQCIIRAYCAGRSRVSVRFVVEDRLCMPIGLDYALRVAFLLDSLGWVRACNPDSAKPGERTWWWTRSSDFHSAAQQADDHYLLLLVDRRVSWLAERLIRLESFIEEQSLFEVLPADFSTSLGAKGVLFESEEQFGARLPDEPHKRGKKR